MSTYHVACEDLSDWVHGASGSIASMSVEQHVARCATCQADVAGLVASAPEQPLPDLVDVWSRVRDEIELAPPSPLERLPSRLGLPTSDATLVAAAPSLHGPWLTALCSALLFVAAAAASESRVGTSLFLPGSTPRPSVQPQELGFPRGFSSFAFVNYMAILKEWSERESRQAEVRRVLAAVGLDEVPTKRISRLSGGQRRRVGLAQALLGTPELLVPDEPTTGLDPEQRASLRQVLAEIATTSTLIISTHQTEDVAALCERVVVLDAGRVHFDGSVQDLVARAAGRVWLADTAEPSAQTSWRTASGRYRNVGAHVPTGQSWSSQRSRADEILEATPTTRPRRTAALCATCGVSALCAAAFGVFGVVSRRVWPIPAWLWGTFNEVDLVVVMAQDTVISAIGARSSEWPPATGGASEERDWFWS